MSDRKLIMDQERDAGEKKEPADLKPAQADPAYQGV